MADSLPSPPASSSSSSSDCESLQEDQNDSSLATKLDGLLENYLGLLDTYTKLREDLSKTFAAGFLSLAQAQRSSTLGAGRRYGQDSYDQRMKAHRIVDTKTSKTEPRVFGIEKRIATQNTQAATATATIKDTATTDTKTSPPLPEAPIQAQSDTHPSKSSSATLLEKRIKQDPALRDPLTWFGILAPPALRSTQSNFIRASQETIPALLNIDAEMRGLESSIWSLREQLGLMAEYASAPEDLETDLQRLKLSRSHGAKPADLSDSQHPARSIGRTLPQQSAHAKSSLLRLGD